MHFPFHSILLAAGLLISPLLAFAEGWTLESAKSAFEHVKAGDNHVCIMHDGWHIAFLSHDTKQIAAVLITENEDADDHEYDLTDTVSRVAELVGMDSPESMEFDSDGPETSLLVDKSLLDELAEDTEHVFSGSPVEAMAYLLNDEYFFIEKVLPNGFMHWKTVKKSGVELLMPLGPPQLTAVEIVGRQFMDEFACNVLARKLGFGGNTASNARRRSLSQEMGVFSIPYMNTSSEVIAAHSKERVLFGKKQTVNHMFANRYGSTLLYPAQSCDWPNPQKTAPEPQVVEQPKEPVKVEVKPLTPAEAREAYSEYLKNL